MSKFTEFLNLFKWDSVEDAEEEFDIDKSLNDNWDKIDTKLKDYMTNTDDSINSFKTSTNNDMEKFKASTNNDMEKFKNDTTDKLSEFETKINESIDSLTADTYDKTKTYAVNDIVIQDGLLYKCKTAVTTAEEFDNSKWEKISILDNMLFFVKEGEF